MTGAATFSSDEKFRFTLTREWTPGLPKVCFIGLNPSTATAEVDDPTIRRCIAFARGWEYGGILMLNLFAYRATKPRDMFKVRHHGRDIIGGHLNSFEKMDEYIRENDCRLVVGAWGKHAAGRGYSALQYFRERLHCLRLNGDRSPEHPLYIPADAKPFLWTASNG